LAGDVGAEGYVPSLNGGSAQLFKSVTKGLLHMSNVGLHVHISSVELKYSNTA